jgi:3-phenylpropionate/cinnamic acid dioxygenase small subunit
MPTITGSVEDREQIRELYARYAIYLDSSKFEEWVNCFTEDGIFESPSLGKHTGHAALRRFCASLREKRAGAQVRLNPDETSSLVDLERRIPANGRFSRK